jgi:hypothetical protein
MRMFLAVVVLIGISIGQASAACTCQCVGGQVQSVCAAPTDLPAICVPAVCTGAPPEGFLPQGALGTEATPPAGAEQPKSAIRQPPTTVPPATTVPALPPQPGVRTASPGAQPRSTTGLGSATETTPPSTTFTEPPSKAPGPQSLCYQRRVFNINTLEYEWQQICD